LLLDIQDKNIEIGENAVELRSYQGRMSKFITAKLTYTPAYCECCGVKNEDYTIYKNGTKTSRITLPISGVYTTYLNLKKQRFYCKECNGTFSASTSLVQIHCFISDHTKAKIIVKLTDAQSLTDIAKDCMVSTSTVQLVNTNEAKKHHQQYQSLPKHLLFDEFKYNKGTVAFEYVDAETGDIIDILERRDARAIKEHFIRN